VVRSFGVVCLFSLCSSILAACGSVVYLGPVGGPGGNAFDDRSEPPALVAQTRLSQIHISKSSVILGLPGQDIIHFVQNEYTDASNAILLGPKHGGGTLGCCEFIVDPIVQFDPGEFLIGICGRAARFIDSISFITNKWSNCDLAYGGTGGNPFFLVAPPGYAIRQFYGRSGVALDAIGIIVEEESRLPKADSVYQLGAVGGWGGEPFQDSVQLQPLSRVNKVIVTESCYVNSVEFEYIHPDGTKARSGQHGGSGTCPEFGRGWIVAPQEIQLDSDEFIRGIRGRAGTLIDSLAFVTNKRVLGPFGASSGGNPFNLVAPFPSNYQVRRLFGRSGGFLDAVGIIVEPR
jgi:Jacalin-like lectin domain